MQGQRPRGRGVPRSLKEGDDWLTGVSRPVLRLKRVPTAAGREASKIELESVKLGLGLLGEVLSPRRPRARVNSST
jgi:hypothetical protein